MNYTPAAAHTHPYIYVYIPLPPIQLEHGREWRRCWASGWLDGWMDGMNKHIELYTYYVMITERPSQNGGGEER